ncbi:MULTISPECIES: F0F1 ATP synthase subunit B [unclassified Prochlorococcus]|uniref:F0F1 ATP synthase subunit B n=1 Tax=unclassified Prochlorococcus TaxID=2627481 RepID=UPI000533A833|nr:MULTISPECIES: F0F1 ATP synthase subunit B [unclassified Prochlorococcus]KGG14787.1 ATP synthase B chain [Prochlorococcus sp. MIT 0602]KGG15779.1 ATP synthase B chain [Prochlorococcus sp. MIT 0603]
MNHSLLFAAQGFGLNLNLFETNILNLAVVIFGLYKFLPNFLGSMLERRRFTILQDLKDAEERLADASNSLKKAKLELASAEKKAGKIREDCRARADAIRLESEKRTVLEMARIKQGAASDLNLEASRVSSQLRREAAKLAIEKALSSLSKNFDEKSQDKFLKQSIKNIGDI